MGSESGICKPYIHTYIHTYVIVKQKPLSPMRYIHTYIHTTHTHRPTHLQKKPKKYIGIFFLCNFEEIIITFCGGAIEDVLVIGRSVGWGDDGRRIILLIALSFKEYAKDVKIRCKIRKCARACIQLDNLFFVIKLFNIFCASLFHGRDTVEDR